MIIPNIETLNDTQRQEKYIKVHYSDFWSFLQDKYPQNIKFTEKMYLYFNELDHPKRCLCGNFCRFIGYRLGYSSHCSKKCSANDKAVRKKYTETCLETYGVDNVAKAEAVQEKIVMTNKLKRGVTNVSMDESIQEKKRCTCLKNNNTQYPAQNSDIYNKMVSTLEERTGYKSPMQVPEYKDKAIQTNLNKYGVEYTCLLQEVRNGNKTISKVNKNFAQLMDEYNIQYEWEYAIKNRSYDFKVGNILIELNPFATHNINWSIFNKETGIDKDYHYNKSKLAFDNGFCCLHIWDWDNLEKILKMLSFKETIYARKCILKEVDKKEADNFLEDNHLQGSCKGAKIRIGLYYNDELVHLMTFGKPRYNKNYDWELLRLCSNYHYKVVGGSEKLFKYFISNYKGSIISYCDNSKFTGEVYNRLGFTLLKTPLPSRQWYNGKTKKHITDSLLRQRGFDQLFNTSYGKGTSNEELMLQNGFVEIYDCGQSSYSYINI